MIKDFGLFIGFTCLPAYSDDSFTSLSFLTEYINQVYEKYKVNLELQFTPNQNNNEIYQPIHFSAIGNFDLITISLIDDYYFGNFHFRPFSKNSKDLNSKTNLQYQIINSAILEISSNISQLNDFNNYNYINVCRLKVNSGLIFKYKEKILPLIIKLTKLKLERIPDLEFVISESYSWHDFTIVFLSNSANTIIKTLKIIRQLSSTDFINLFPNISLDTELIKHLFVDSHSTFGLNLNLFKLTISQLNDSLIKDQNISINSKLQIKTGHGSILIKLLNKYYADLIVIKNMSLVDGRSDLHIKFNSIPAYINFWQIALNKQEDTLIFSHLRKIHSNLFDVINDSDNENLNLSHNEFDTTYHTISFNEYKFSTNEIVKIENNLKSLNISKEIINNIVSCYSGYNDIICDVTLFQYSIDLRPLLDNLSDIINTISNKDYSKYESKFPSEYSTVSSVSKLLLEYAHSWQRAFQNRFQESKRYGYNSDSKIEFNGGVHQLIQIYDALYKLVVENFQILDKNTGDYLPIATYGSQVFGIRSTINNLHINYSQLFYPEFFIFALPKEALNQQLKRFKFPNNSLIKRLTVDKIISIREEIINILHLEYDLIFKQLLYEYCSPDMIKERLNYIITYAIWISNTYEIQKLDIFIHWFWFVYIQSSENYNTNGSFRVQILKRTMFDFFIAINFIDPKYTIDNFLSNFKCTELCSILINKNNLSENSIKDEIQILFEYLKSKDIINEVHTIINSLQRTIDELPPEKSTQDLYNKIKSVTITFTENFLSLLSKNCTEYKLIRKTGSGQILKDFDYGNISIDPQGGYLIRNYNDRLSVFKMRKDLFNDLKEIAWNYKF